MVSEPVPDQSSPVEINIIPDDNEPGLLWSVLYNCDVIVVSEQVTDKSNTMEINIIPDDNKPGLLWSVLYNYIM